MKKMWLFLFQLLILIGISELGSFITSFFNLVIPGNVIGILLLFILLHLNIIKLEWIDLTASFLVKHLAFFFIPIAISLMTFGTLFMQQGFPLALCLVISLIIGFIVCAFLVQKLAERGEKKQHEHAHHDL